MSALPTVVRKDLLRFLRDPVSFIFWLGTPLIVGGLLMTVLGGGSGPALQARLLVADEDDSVVSRFLVGAFGQGRAKEVFQVELLDREAGARLVRQDKASALLIIPDGFGEAVLKETDTKIELVTNPAQRIAPGLIEDALSILADGVFYLHRLFGPQLRAMTEGPPAGATLFDDARVSEISVEINRGLHRLDRFLFPPVIRLEFGAPPPPEPEAATAPAAPRVSIQVLFVPSILLMGLLFAAQGLASDLWHEHTHRTLHRAFSSPLGLGSFLAGKLLASGAVLGLIALVLLAAAMARLRLPLGRLPLAWSWSVASGVFFVTLFLFLQVQASSERAASILTFTLIFPLMMLGGSFFPIEIMPAWMAAIGRHTPNGWAAQQLKACLIGSAPGTGHALAFAAMLGGAFALFLLSSIVIRGRMIRK